MDDAWGTEVWTDLGSAFPDDSYGNRILFTSRFIKVASDLGSVHPLRFLNETKVGSCCRKRYFMKVNAPRN